MPQPSSASRRAPLSRGSRPVRPRRGQLPVDVARPVRRSGSGAARAADGDGGGGQRKDWWADYASRPLEFGLSPAAVPHVEYQFATADRDLPTKWLAVVAGTPANIVRMYQEPYGPTLVVGQLQ